MITAGLRIKRIYFKAILSGEKKIEYRDFKPFYHNRFRDIPTHIRFHYQKRENFVCEVLRIEVISTPDFLRETRLPFGEKVYAIHLGEIVESNLD